MAASIICSVHECDNPVLIIKRGLCRRHYLRWLRHGDPLGGGPPKTKDGAPLRFVQKTLKSKTTECVEWPYATVPSGYGTITITGKTVGAHRYVCQKVFGDPPTQSHQAAHYCGNRKCINPRHIRWATPVENSRDMVGHGTVLRGESSSGAKITQEQAIRIYRAKGSMSERKAAKFFEVSKTIVHRIWVGRTWGWLTESL